MPQTKEEYNRKAREYYHKTRDKQSDNHYKCKYGEFWECAKIIYAIDREIINQVPNQMERRKLKCSYEREIINNLLRRKRKFTRTRNKYNIVKTISK